MSLAELFFRKNPRLSFGSRFSRLSRASRRPDHSALSPQSSLSSTRHSSLVTRHFLLEPLEPRVLLSAAPTLVAEGLLPQTEGQIHTEAAQSSAQLPSLDVDLNGVADTATDGKLILRYMAGVPDEQLIAGGVVGAGAQRNQASDMRAYLDALAADPSKPLDADGDGTLDPFKDGRLLFRYLGHVTDEQLLAGSVLGANASRTDALAITTFLATIDPAQDTTPPIVTAGLQTDTGLSPSDAITSEATITGHLADVNLITGLTGVFDATPVGSFTDILADLNRLTGEFTLTPFRLAQLAGGTLADGAHTLHLQATDARGNQTANFFDVGFTLDRTTPTPTFGLALTSDSGTLGDQQTEAGRVTLIGQTDPNATVVLQSLGLTTLATSTGTFQFPDVPLVVGSNPFTVQATDLAGNSGVSAAQSVTRLDVPLQPDMALQWDQEALEAIRRDAVTPLVASRGLAMVSAAMYDVVNAIEGTPGYFITTTATPGTSSEAAVAAAAHRLLAYLFPAQQTLLDTALTQDLATVPDGAEETQGVTLGQSIADTIIALRATDGWDDFVDYVPGTQPGRWQETAPMFDVALAPQWADLTPFALTSPDQFRPAGPPALTSQAYADAFNEVKALGSATGSTRTAEQTEIARFWADGLGTYTPPGHWNEIANDLALSQGNSLSANARLFAKLNLALADAAITAWNTKYLYEFWRPITAIQQADLDGHADTTKDAAWTPLLITPPFPEYVSGHSTFSGAAAEVLTAIFGNSLGFTTDSLGLPGVQRSFTDFDQAAQEAGRSRIYGGIHFEFSNQDGLAAGHQLAQFVLNRFAISTDTQAPTILIDSPQANSTVKQNLTVQGRVLDNLSGVETFTVQLDAAAPVAVTVNADGTFTVPLNLPLDGSAEGPHTLTFQATDQAGNATAPVLLPLTLDTLVPTVTLTAPVSSDILTVASRLIGTVSGTGSAITKLTYAFDGGTAMPITIDPVSGVIDEPLDLSKLTVGNHTMTVTAQDAAGNVVTTDVSVSLNALIPLTMTDLTPANGASDVGSTFRPQVFFSRAVNPATLNANNFYATDSAGTKLAATIVPAQDGTFAWLFLTNPMPGGETITIHIEGDTILGATDGQPLDANGDGTPGGTFTSNFSTVSLIPIPGTTITGRVVDPGPDLKPMTFDDIRVGPDGILHTSDDVFLTPIANARVFIVGLEDQAVFTDAEGRFTLLNVPAGNVKVAVDGRTATNATDGVFFPEMVMDVTIEPGLPNTLMGSMGTPEEQRANETRGEVYLPRLETTILQTVSNTQNTVVGVTAKSAPDLTTQETQNLFLTVPPNSAVGPDGQPISNAQIGISTVPPEMIRGMLPQGILQLANTITIQARGPNGEIIDRFVDPIQLTFPNVYNAAPGSKLNFYSFDHTTGRLVIEGTATVSADGKSVTTDLGQGITKPGWHGLFSAVVQALRESGLDKVDDLFYSIADAVSKKSEELGSELQSNVDKMAARADELYEDTKRLSSTIENEVRQGINPILS